MKVYAAKPSIQPFDETVGSENLPKQQLCFPLDSNVLVMLEREGAGNSEYVGVSIDL
jgi:hypothetical protein